MGNTTSNIPKNTSDKNDKNDKNDCANLLTQPNFAACIASLAQKDDITNATSNLLSTPSFVSGISSLARKDDITNATSNLLSTPSFVTGIASLAQKDDIMETKSSILTSVSNLQDNINLSKSNGKITCPPGWKYESNIQYTYTYIQNTGKVNVNTIINEPVCTKISEKKYNISNLNPNQDGLMIPTDYSCPIGDLYLNGNATTSSPITAKCIIKLNDYKNIVCPYGFTATPSMDICNR